MLQVKSKNKNRSKYTNDNFVPIKSITNGMIILDNNERVTGIKIVPRNIFILDYGTQNAIIDNLEQDEQNQITMIMSEDYEITDIEKAIDDVVQAYEREKLNTRKFEILDLLDKNLENDQKKELEKELSNIIIRLAKIK